MSIESQSEEDARLVLDALANTDDFSKLIVKYEAKLLRYIKRTLFVNQQDAEDILQEVFISTYRNLNNYNPKYKFSSWIYRITYNACISHYRNNKKYLQQANLDFESDAYKVLADDTDMDANIIREIDKQRLSSALKKLDEKYRNVLMLKFIEEKDYEEISEIMHIPSGTVGSLINRGKIKLKELLKNG